MIHGPAGRITLLRRGEGFNRWQRRKGLHPELADKASGELGIVLITGHGTMPDVPGVPVAERLIVRIRATIGTATPVRACWIERRAHVRQYAFIERAARKTSGGEITFES